MHTVQDTHPITRSQPLSRHITTIAVASVMSIALALFAVFGLAEWAESSVLHHAIQHIMLFMGGVGVGGSLLAVIRRESTK